MITYSFEIHDPYKLLPNWHFLIAMAEKGLAYTLKEITAFVHKRFNVKFSIAWKIYMTLTC